MSKFELDYHYECYKQFYRKTYPSFSAYMATNPTMHGGR